MSRIPALDGVPYPVAWFDFECDSDFTRMIPQPGWTPPEEIALPEFKRDAAGVVIPGQERLLWKAYTDAVLAAQATGPDLGAILALVKQVKDAPLRDKINAAVNADKADPVKLAKHLERIKKIVSIGTDTQPVAAAPAAASPAPKEEI